MSRLGISIALQMLSEQELAVRAFFDRYAEHYKRSWDLKAHGLHVGIFDRIDYAPASDALESAYQRSRDHVVDLLEKVRPLSAESQILDVCCGTGATLSQIAATYGCLGTGVDISPAQIELAVRLRVRPFAPGKDRLRFLEGTASRIDEAIRDAEPFTHVFSQDGLLFVEDREAALHSIHAALVPGGALVISDFVPSFSPEALDEAIRARVYDDVKWSQGLRFQGYLDLLEGAGFKVMQAELRPSDMRATYAALAPRTRALAAGGDEVYSFLANRYEGIVKAVDNQALTWGWFAARRR